MKRNCSHFSKLRATGQLYKMSARRVALESRAEHPTEDTESVWETQHFPMYSIDASEGCPTVESQEDDIYDAEESSDMEDEGNERRNMDEDAPTEVISSGRVSPFRNMELKEALQYWANTMLQSHASVNMILEIFHELTIYKHLPKDARTILQTPRHPLNIMNIDGGRYFYNGVKHCLISHLEHVEVPETININVSIDGLPLYKGSPSSFWPILVNVHEIPRLSPMVVAVFHGITKPPQLKEYLGPFVEEMNDVIENGIPINNRILRVRLRAFICDAPARAYIKGVVYFNAKHGCMKCCTVGEFSSHSRTVFFRDSDAPERTDVLFRKLEYPDHYREYTPLLLLKHFDIIQDVVVADRLHLIDLGVMRRLIRGWLNGAFGAAKWTTTQSDRISNALENMELPSEIHRDMRSLEHIKYWKGTEYSSFLHYASLAVLKDNLSKQAYEHFLLLFSAITILSSRAYEENWGYAGQLLQKFVTQFDSVYGVAYVTSNIHNLLHVFNDVRKFGPLHSISSYPFENELQHIKKLQRSGYKCLEQVARRLMEAENANIMKLRVVPNSQIYLEETRIEVIVVFPDFILRKGHRDGWFLSNNLEVVKYSTACGIGSSIKIKGNPLKETNNYFDTEFQSTGINICTGNLSTLDSDEQEYDPNEIKCKYVSLKLQEYGQMLFVPLLHTLKH